MNKVRSGKQETAVIDNGRNTQIVRGVITASTLLHSGVIAGSLLHHPRFTPT